MLESEHECSQLLENVRAVIEFRQTFVATNLKQRDSRQLRPRVICFFFLFRLNFAVYSEGWQHTSKMLNRRNTILFKTLESAATGFWKQQVEQQYIIRNIAPGNHAFMLRNLPC